MECKITNPKRRVAGIALTEVMIAVGLSAMVLTTLFVIYVYHLRAFSSLENYMNLNNESRGALDQMSREIRQADSLKAFSINSFTLVVKLGGVSTDVTYYYDTVKKQVRRKTAVKDQLLLAGCDQFQATIYDRNEQTNAVTLSNCKIVQVTWICSRNVLGKKNNTEDVQSAKIVIRKQKTS